MKTKFGWQVLVFTLVRLVLNTIFRMVYPFRGVFEEALGVSFAQMSRGLGMRSFLGFFAPLLGAIGDRRGRKSGMQLGLVIFVVGLGIVIVWPTYLGFIAALIATTLGKFTYDPSLQAYIGDRVGYERRGRVLSVVEYSWSLAYLLGGLAVGVLLSRFGWKSPFVVMAVLGLLGIAAVRWLLPDAQIEEEKRQKRFAGFRLVFSSKGALTILAMMALVGLANELVNLEFGPWLQESFGLELLALGGASAVLGLSELGGEGLVTLVTDKLGKPKAVGLGLLVNIVCGLLLPLLGGQVWAAVVGLGLFYFSYEFLLVSAVPMISEVLPQARGTMMAFMFAALSLGRLLGSLINPGLHGIGFWATAAATAVFNLIALLALSRVKVGEADGRTDLA